MRNISSSLDIQNSLSINITGIASETKYEYGKNSTSFHHSHRTVPRTYSTWNQQTSTSAILCGYLSRIFTMAAFSKYFRIAARDLPCNQLSHGGGTCTESIIENFTRTIPGCVKFVLPLALVSRKTNNFTKLHNINGNIQILFKIPIIMKVKHLNKHVFSQSFRIFVDYFLGAWTISGLGLSGICVFRWISSS